MSTLICVPIMVHDEAQAAADAQAARDSGADLIEFRIDEFFTGARNAATGELDDAQVKAILRLIASSPLACIVTCRAAAESGGVGGYTDDESARVSLYERLGIAASTSESRGHAPAAGRITEHPPRYLDFEFASFSRSANIRQKINLAVTHPGQIRKDISTGLILSTHDFTGRPADLTRRILAMQSESAASVVKFAFRARSLRDNLEIFDLLKQVGSSMTKPMIGLAMGEFGLMSRVLAPKFNAFLTFASLKKTSATAPGQPTVAELLDLYRFRSIKPGTKLYGVVGWPVSHSLSPLIHNAGFEAVGHDGVYLPLPIAADQKDPEKTYLSFKATLEDLLAYDGLDLSGLSVTMPFKECLFRWGREYAPADVRAIGAANTLCVNQPPSTSSTKPHYALANTDALAIAALLEQKLGAFDQKSVAVVGAGGVARAAAWACASRGAIVTIYNRTLSKAQAVQAELDKALKVFAPGSSGGVNAQAFDDLLSSAHDAYINCTPLGMADGPKPQALSIPVDRMPNLPRHAVFLDTVYRPIDTPLVRVCRDRSYSTIDGVSMFVEQAAAQFELWTNKPAPRSLFERICREHQSVST